MNKSDLELQLGELESGIENLHQPATIIHALAHYSDLNKFDISELEETLKGINTVLYYHINSLAERVEFIKTKLGGNDDKTH
ncbi:hypothetical protein C8D76_105126 [Pasteurella langaaensis DSM 22999]|uniref:Uncharacterized protein n=1 Tax=Alitibacter langaaensis DSM 22999 TaxID=1122935 RepID=A0A2U0T835_9PAST|nr:hypothetical protein [Pasteurella langaaensis]PVX39783.1 hypothetical protein C8D76_105126 [Pasteurella langaaensis DSM 22999]